MSSKISISYLNTPFGELILGDFESTLCLCDWRYRKMRSSIDERIKVGLKANFTEENTAILNLAKQQIDEYLSKEREKFDLPFILIGTDFQKNVWDALCQIPYGQTDSYLGLSQKLGNEKAIRAIASANGANALSLIIPCHRIIGSDKSLVGYAGGINTKKKLLTMEGSYQESQLKLF